MNSSNMSFIRIEPLRPSGSGLIEVGSGSLSNIFSFSYTQVLNQIGKITFTMPLADLKSDWLIPGTVFDVYLEKLGSIGYFYFQSKQISTNADGVNTVDVTAFDSLVQMTKISTKRRQYNNVSIASAVNDLCALVGFNSSVELTGNTLMATSYQSVLAAIDAIRDNHSGAAYRISWNSASKIPTLELGYFGDLSPYHAENFSGQVMASFLSNPNHVLITALTENTDAYTDTIANRVYGLGSGSNETQLTMEGATGDYPVLSGTNPDGSEYFYVEDTDSQDEHGLHERVLTFPTIAPLSNGQSAILLARQALFEASVSFMKKHLTPRKEYSLDVVNLGPDLNVGDKLSIRYVTPDGRFNIIGDYFVLEIDRNISADGNSSARLIISDQNNKRSSDTDLVVSVIQNINAINLANPIQVAYSETNYFLRVRGDANPANRVNGTAILRIRDEVTLVLRSLLRIETQPLKSSAAGADHSHLMFSTPGAALGATTLKQVVCADSPGASGLINLNLAFQTGAIPTTPLYTFQASGGADSLEYGVFENSGFCAGGVGVIINGVDIGVSLGTSSTGIVEEIDITQYIEQAGVQGEHTIEFYATSGVGDVIVTIDNLLGVMPLFIS